MVLLVAIAGAAFTAGWQLARPVQAVIGTAPARLGAEAISFTSKSGSTIHGWFVPVEMPRGAILLLPSIRSNRLSMVRRAEFLKAAGYATLLIDFQATGESRGDAITFGWRERYDVLAAERFVRTRVGSVPVGVIGSSLGGAAALLATPPLNAQALILEAVYPSIDVAVENRLRIRAGRVGAALAPLLLWQLPARIGATRDQLRPIDHMPLVRCPVLVIGGAADRHTTEADTQRLFAAAPEPKALWLLPGVAHVDFLDAAGPEYRDRVLRFLEIAFGVRHAEHRWVMPGLKAGCRVERRDAGSKDRMPGLKTRPTYRVPSTEHRVPTTGARGGRASTPAADRHSRY